MNLAASILTTIAMFLSTPLIAGEDVPYRPVGCSLTVDGEDVVTGECMFYHATDGLVFSTGQNSNHPHRAGPIMFAVLTGFPIDTAEMKEQYIETEGPLGPTGAFLWKRTLLGAVTQKDDTAAKHSCWENERARICAWEIAPIQAPHEDINELDDDEDKL